MAIVIKLYRNEKWFEFANKVKEIDGNLCVRCGRTEPDVVLQVHHQKYIDGHLPWEYSIDDCVTLCKGCHAREHGLIEPNKGWTTIDITDLGDKSGICERGKCDTSIRYEHTIYHPKWGYMTVGSTCVDHLTEKERDLSKELIKLSRKINTFIKKTPWYVTKTKEGYLFVDCKIKNHFLRLYKTENQYCFKVAIKKKGNNGFESKKWVYTQNNNLEQSKKMAYLSLKGFTSKNEDENKLLKEIYEATKNSNL